MCMYTVEVGKAIVSFDPRQMSRNVIIEGIRSLGYEARWDQPSESGMKELVPSQ